MTVSVELTVVEAPESDVGHGRARIDAASRPALGVDAGAIVEIVGKKGSGARVFRLTSEEDEGKGIIRIDGLVRRNIGVSLGDKVEVRKAEVLLAERIAIAPILSQGHKIGFGEGIENFVKRALLTRPLAKGDVVTVPGIALMSGALPFMVIKTTPKGIVQITEDTLVELEEDALREDKVAALLQERVRLNHVVLHVRDIQRTLPFYRDALRLEVESQGPGRVLLHGSKGSATLKLRQREADTAPAPSTPAFRLYLEVADLDGECERLRGLGVIVSGPHDPEDGTHPRREALVTDPDGNEIGLYE